MLGGDKGRYAEAGTMGRPERHRFIATDGLSEKESSRDDEGEQTSEYSREEMIGSLQRRGLMRDLLRDDRRGLGDEVKDVGTG